MTPPKPMSEKEIAKKLGLSRARVWQIKTLALQKLRQAILADRELSRYVRDEFST